MAPRELILTMTKNRMDKLNQFGGSAIPIRVKGAGKSGEFTALMVPKNSGGMLSAAGQRGGNFSAAGMQRGGTNWLNVAKKASAVASPLAMQAGPEMAPVSAGLAAFAGSGKKKKAGVSKKTGKKVKKGIDLAAQIGSIIAPRAQSERSEASVAARGGGYQENGHASSVGTIAAAKLFPFKVKTNVTMF